MTGEMDEQAVGGSARQWLEAHSTADVTFTADGVLLEYNLAAERMFRVPPGVDMHGANVLEYVVLPERLAEVVRGVQLTGRIENWDCEFRRMDGSSLHTVVNLVGNFDGDRALISLRAHIFNITEWRRGHERALFGHRAEALGRLAGGVAHEFNNLLTVIMGHGERLLAAAADSAQRSSAAAIIDSSVRAAALTRQLLAFARRQMLQPRVVDLNNLLRSVVADLRRTFGRRIAVTVNLAESLQSVHVDPEQIEHVLSTLAAHGVESMPHGGTLTFSTRRAIIGADRPRALYFVQPGSYARVDVSHTGTPLDHDTQMRLFEPFFAEDGLGRTGLGLAAAFGVVKQSGGFIWVDSGAGPVTTFTFLLPLHAHAAPAETAVSSAADSVNDATILVVDDEPLVRRFIGDALRASGYDVIEAASAEQGEDLAVAFPGRVHLMIADVNLGGISGPQLGERLRERDPRLGVLYVSGREAEEHLGGAPNTAFLLKPFSAALLIQRVRELLGSGSS